MTEPEHQRPYGGSPTPPPPPPPPFSAPPPPPGYGQPPAYPPAPPQPYGAPPAYPQYPQPPQYGHQPLPPGYAPWQGAPAKPPRPSVKAAGVLMLLGAAATLIGCFLPWWEIFGVSINGFDAAEDETGDGAFFATIAVILAGFGITLLAAGRVLAIAIIAVVVGAISVLAAISDLSDVVDVTDALGGSVGIGLPVILAGSAASTVGGIVALAKRRR
jgi:hypothetical protein